MLKSKKHVLWEALVVAVAVFCIGLFIGMMVEGNNQAEIMEYSINSEVLLLDAFNFANLVEESDSGCEVLIIENIEFANRVYDEAIILEDYENIGLLTENMKSLHKKYDLLRSILWVTNTKVLERCGDRYDLVVYLYEYQTEDPEKKAEQAVLSRMFYELKKERGDEVVLLPIAGNQNFSSINLLREKYKINRLPALIINNDKVLYELNTIDEIKEILDEGRGSAESGYIAISLN